MIISSQNKYDFDLRIFLSWHFPKVESKRFAPKWGIVTDRKLDWYPKMQIINRNFGTTVLSSVGFDE